MLDTPSAGLPTSNTNALPENGTSAETADLRADALADAGSYVPGSDGVTEFGTIEEILELGIPVLIFVTFALHMSVQGAQDSSKFRFGDDAGRQKYL